MSSPPNGHSTIIGAPVVVEGRAGRTLEVYIGA